MWDPLDVTDGVGSIPQNDPQADQQFFMRPHSFLNGRIMLDHINIACVYSKFKIDAASLRTSAPEGCSVKRNTLYSTFVYIIILMGSCAGSMPGDE